MTTLASAGPQGELDCVVGRRIHRTRRDYLEFIDRERFAIIAPLATWQAGLRGEYRSDLCQSVQVDGPSSGISTEETAGGRKRPPAERFAWVWVDAVQAEDRSARDFAMKTASQ